MQMPRSKTTSVKRLSRDHKMPRYQTTEMHYEWSFERLFRYAARPPLSMDRLEALPDGRLRYWFKTAWRNGTTHAIFEPLEVLEKLAALVPTPRAHLVRFHGLLAPAAKWRPSIVPHNATTEAPPDSPGTDETTATSSGADVAHCDERQKPADAAQRHARNYAWSELMKRVFAADVLACIHCGGRLRILATIRPREITRKILDHFMHGVSCASPCAGRTATMAANTRKVV